MASLTLTGPIPDNPNTGGPVFGSGVASAPLEPPVRTDSSTSANDPITPPDIQSDPNANPGGTRQVDLQGGSSATNFDLPSGTSGSRIIDVVRNFPWTLSNTLNRDDIPEVILYEHRNEESQIKRQLLFYGLGLGGQIGAETGKAVDFVTGLTLGALKNFTGIGVIGQALGFWDGWLNPTTPSDVASNPAASKQLLDVYEEIFPDSPTNNQYYFPYFTKNYMELASPPWEQLDDIGSTIDNLVKGGADLSRSLGGAAGKDFGETLDRVRSVGGAVSGGFMGYLKTQYPVVGIFDRPRIFSSHNERDLTIQFPLYNTINPSDWKKNRALIYKMMTQFLYLKNSYITGYPPVFYRVLVPGQYFSFASCVTNFSVDNLGNIRKIEGYNIPDAFQVTLTLREMCMPSLNQFQAMASGEAAGKVEAKIEVGSSRAAGSRDLIAPGALQGSLGNPINSNRL